MSFYETQNLPNFSVKEPVGVLSSDVAMLNNTIQLAEVQAVYNSASGVTYSAEDLLNGYVVRKGVVSEVVDSLPTASSIITGLSQRIQTLSQGLKTLSQGTAFETRIYNASSGASILYSSNDLSVRVGAETQALLSGGCTTLLTVIVQDIASLGNGHTDQVFVCVDSCNSCTPVIPPESINISGTVYIDPSYLSVYPFYVDVTWNEFANATSYTYSTDYSSQYLFVSTGAQSVRMYFTDSSIYFFNITITGQNSCSTGSASGQANPCFLAGSLVALADGSSIPIENVKVGDTVVGAFGEHNTVLALHRPKLGNARMMCINEEHNSTSHHPHVSHDKKFYTMHPEVVSKGTYGREHEVIVADGSVQKWKLEGLKPERINKLVEGICLKTIDGSKVVDSLRVYTMAPETQLYNLAVSGSHTYHVDGYAVTGFPSESTFCYDTWTRKN